MDADRAALWSLAIAIAVVVVGWSLAVVAAGYGAAVLCLLAYGVTSAVAGLIIWVMT